MGLIGIHTREVEPDLELQGVLESVIEEYERACEDNAPFNSAHEGLAVLREEYLELEQKVFWGRKGKTDYDWIASMHDEAKQVAAMAIRFLMDVDFPGRLR